MHALTPAYVFTLHDLAGSLWGTIIFAVALLTPGYCAGHALNFCSFRSQGLAERLAWSLALSLGVATLPLVALVWLTGLTATAAMLAATAILSVLLLGSNPTPHGVTRREVRFATLLVIGWTTLVLFSLVDIGIGHRLWTSVTTYDHALRVNFVAAVLRSGVPPANPLFWPGHDAPMRYYYFWYVLCALVARIAHISARQALIASCVWPFFALCAVLGLFWRYLLHYRGMQLRRRWLSSVSLMAVTGLDLLVTIANQLTGQPTSGDMEWWAVDTTSSWADSLLWVPHHVAALAASLLAMLLVLLAAREHAPRLRFLLAVTAGLSLASAFGMSVYLPLGAAILLAVWLLAELRAPESRTRILQIALTTVLAAVLPLTPYLLQLAHSNTTSTQQRSAHILTLGVRHILNLTSLSSAPAFQPFAAKHPETFQDLAALVTLPVGYAVELGFFGLALLLSRRVGGPAASTLRLFTWSGLVAVTFLRSSVLHSNDFAMRASLLPQFFLLLLATEVLACASARSRRWLLLLAAVGVAGTVYQLATLRVFLPWQQTHGNPEMRDLAERNQTIRSLYSTPGLRFPAAAHLQYSRAAADYLTKMHLLNAPLPVVYAEESCDADFGGDQAACAPIQQSVAMQFPMEPELTPTAAEAYRLCARLGTDYLAATQWDSIWLQRNGWVWTLPVVAEVPDARLLACAKEK